MVRQVMCAVVAEFVSRLVARMMCATDCGTRGEMVTAMVSGTKAGMLVHMPGDATGEGQAGNRMPVQSAEAWLRSSPATPNRAWTEFGGASVRVTTRFVRFGLTQRSDLTQGKHAGPFQTRLSAWVGTRRR